MGTPLPKYTAEFKQKAVELYRKSGTTYAEVARGLGCDAGSPSDRAKKADAADAAPDGNPFQMEWLYSFRHLYEGFRLRRWPMRDPKHPRHFTEEFKRQIVDLYHAGKPLKDIEAEYDLGHSTVSRWIKCIEENGSTRARGNRTPEEQRLLDLEKENKRLRMEVDVLEQAALIFAQK